MSKLTDIKNRIDQMDGGAFQNLCDATWAIKGIKCLFVGDACNILLNVFSDQNVREYVEAQINLVWDKLESDVEAFLPFFKAFGMHSKIADRTVFFGGKFRKRNGFSLVSRDVNRIDYTIIF